jgi:hypothetical protein
MKRMKKKTQIAVKSEWTAPGTVIPKEEIEQYHREVGASMPYWCFVMLLQQAIFLQSEADGRPVATCQRRGDVHVLTSAQASVYFEKRNEDHVAGLVRGRDGLIACVRPDELSPEEARQHDQRVFRVEAQIDVLNKCRNRLGLRDAQELVQQTRALPPMDPDEWTKKK